MLLFASLFVRPFAALGSIFLLGYDPQYRPPIGEKWRAALGSIRSGVYKNIDPYDVFESWPGSILSVLVPTQ